MSFAMYGVGLLVLIGGLVYVAVLSHVHSQWIVAMVIVLLGAGLNGRGEQYEAAGFEVSPPGSPAMLDLHLKRGHLDNRHPGFRIAVYPADCAENPRVQCILRRAAMHGFAR